MLTIQMQIHELTSLSQPSRHVEVTLRYSAHSAAIQIECFSMATDYTHAHSQTLDSQRYSDCLDLTSKLYFKDDCGSSLKCRRTT